MRTAVLTYIPSGSPCGSAADLMSSDHGAESSYHADVGLLEAAESSESLPHLKEEASCFNSCEVEDRHSLLQLKIKKNLLLQVWIKTEYIFIPFILLLHKEMDQSSIISLITWQEGLLHSFHQTLQVMFYIVHHNVDLVHIASNDYFLI